VAEVINKGNFTAMDFKPRKIKFKAWDVENKLMMRLNSIDCNKGELIKPGHILLQFTGLRDSEGEEIYEMDVLMLSLEKFVVFWNEAGNLPTEQAAGWQIAPLKNLTNARPFLTDTSIKMKRFGSYYQLENV
jgi:hypothetical protein